MHMKPQETNHFLNQLDVKLPVIVRLHLAITTRETNISNALTAEDRMLSSSSTMMSADNAQLVTVVAWLAEVVSWRRMPVCFS